MGFGSFLRKSAGAVASTARTVGKIPGVGLIPGVGTALSVVGAASTAVGIARSLTSGGGGSLPPLPALPTASQSAALPMAPGMGNRSIFRNDPNVVDALKPYAIPMRDLRQYYRAPKGFVVMRDAAGDSYGIPKNIAKAYLGWKPAKKPLLSIRDTNAIKHAGSAIKKLQNAEKMAKKIANWHSPRRAAPKNIILPASAVKKIK